MRGSVFYTLAVAFCLGIFIRSLVDLADAYLYELLLVVGAFVFLWYRSLDSRLLLCTLACLGVACGIVRFDMATWGNSAASFDARLETEVTLAGEIVREPDRREHTTHLTLHVDAVDTRVLVFAPRYPAFAYGDRVRVVGTLARPEAFETDLGRTFDYPGYLSAHGITYTISFAEVELIQRGAGSSVPAALLIAKHAFTDRIALLLPEPQAGLAEGLVLGAKRALGADLEEAFRITGLIHIVVLSGYNVSIVAEAIMRLLAFFFSPRIRVFFGIAAIAAFAFIAGFSATVLRASLMAALVLIARATGNVYAVSRGLVFAGIVMLLFNPKLLVFDPGFQLSFLATLGLILLAPLIEAKLGLIPSRFQIREFVTATVATQIFILPLLLYSIGMFSVVAVLANVLVLPAVPPAMLFIFLAGSVALVHTTLALPLAYLAHLLLSYIIGVVEILADIPFAAVPVPAFPFWVVVCSYGVIAIALVRVYRTTRETFD